MAYFPLFTDISHKNVLIVGGGSIALSRAKKLSLFCADITVISDTFTKENLHAFSEFPGVVTLCESFCKAHLKKLCPVLVAICPGEGTGLCPEEIHELCIEEKIPVNVADVPHLCTFIFPAVTTKGHLSVGISTSGCVPMATSVLKQRIDSVIPQNIDTILDGLSGIRQRIYKNVPDTERRKRILRTVTEICFERDCVISERELEEIIKNSL